MGSIGRILRSGGHAAPDEPRPLRSGYTTGSCATATSLAAARLLLAGVDSDCAEIVLPKGQRVSLPLTFCRLIDAAASRRSIRCRAA